MKSNYALQVDIDIAHPKDEHTGIFHGNSASHEVRQNHMNNIYQNLINKIVKNRCNFFNDTRGAAINGNVLFAGHSQFVTL